jgi:hypothetical protein
MYKIVTILCHFSIDDIADVCKLSIFVSLFVSFFELFSGMR